MTEEILEVRHMLREWIRQQMDFRLRVRGHAVQRNLTAMLNQPDNPALRELTARSVADLAEDVACVRSEETLALFAKSKRDRGPEEVRSCD